MISPERINELLRKYVRSDAGQRASAEYIKSLIIEGKQPVGSGSTSVLVTVAEMEAAAQKLIAEIQNTAKSFGLAESITALIDTLSYTKPSVQSDGTYSVEIYFAGDKHRDSLYPKGYPEGVGNIIALLNNGFRIGEDKKPATGMWHGRKTVGLRSREGLHFINTAVSDFIRAYGDAYNVTVLIDPVYEE